MNLIIAIDISASQFYYNQHNKKFNLLEDDICIIREIKKVNYFFFLWMLNPRKIGIKRDKQNKSIDDLQIDNEYDVEFQEFFLINHQALLTNKIDAKFSKFHLYYGIEWE